jgi:hypothetical protein
MFLGMGVVLSHMVFAAPLFILQGYTAALEPARQEKRCATFLSMAGPREVFHRLGVQDVAEFDSD